MRESIPTSEFEMHQDLDETVKKARSFQLGVSERTHDRLDKQWRMSACSINETKQSSVTLNY